MRISRRTFSKMAIGGLLGATVPAAGAMAAAPVLVPAAGAMAAAPVLVPAEKYAPVDKPDSPFGSFTQSWFLDSFLEFADDLADATNRGRRFALLWELDGCPYCREMHLVNFAVPEIREYVEANFDIVQLDLRGARDTVDFDGAALSESQLAKRHGVRFTPTIQFSPETVQEMTGKGGRENEVARMPGYFRPFHFLAMFQFVREKRYITGDFRSFLKTRPRT